MSNQVSYPDGSSDLSTSARWVNLFRAIPLILLAAISLIAILSPVSLYELSRFMDKADGFSPQWNSLYIICGPLALVVIMATIMNYKKLEGRWFVYIAFYLLYPLIVGLSIWLWELLGIVLMFVILMIYPASISKDGDIEKKPFAIAGIIVGIAYIIARLATGHAGWTDVALLCFYGLFPLGQIVLAVVAEESYSTWWENQKKMALYLSIPFVISLFMLGLLLLR
jgi:uncharacterized membrane protein